MKGSRGGEFAEDDFDKLPVYDIDAGAADRIRALAHSVMVGQRPCVARRSGLERAYSCFLEPLLASGVTVFYLIWAITQALHFYRISR